MKNIFLTLIAICLFATPFTYLTAQEKTQVPPTDKIVILLEDYIQGVKTVRTEIIDFSEYPTDVRECKKLAEEYEDFTKLDGLAICYFQGRRLAKYKL